MEIDINSPIVTEMLSELNVILRDNDVAYYLVGAATRDIHLMGHKNYKPKRATKDIDIAIMIPDEEQYYVIKEALIKTGNYKADLKEPIKLYYKNTIEIDLMPFGEIEDNNGDIKLTDPRAIEINMIGFKEMLPYIQQKEINGVTINICPLEGIIILKLLSNYDRPDRIKDLEDINHIISVYFDLNMDDIYANYHDILTVYENVDNNSEYEKIVSQRVIGRKMRALVGDNEALFNKVGYCMLEGSPVIPRWQALYDGYYD